MFGRHYFGGHYFAPRYFPDGGTGTPIVPPPDVVNGRGRRPEDVVIRRIACEIDLVLPSFAFSAELDVLPAQITASLRLVIPQIDMDPIEGVTHPKQIDLSASLLPKSLTLTGSVEKQIAKRRDDA